MRICAVIKYPPIQGGVSAQGYWLTRGLAEAGHEVHVVTNGGEVEDTYRLRLTDEDNQWLEGEFEGGGRVVLHPTEPFSPKLTHIPQANPFVSKLAGLATEVVRQHDCELIFSYYMEPNGIAANMASAWTGRPYIVQHAGSDLGRLMKHPGLDTTYQEVFKRADGIVTGSPYTFLGMGATTEAIYQHPPYYLPPNFTPEDEPLDLQAHADTMAELEPEGVHHAGTLDPTVPTFGIYGKLGEFKGSFDLLAALGLLKREGRRFNFVAVNRGKEMQRYLQVLAEEDLLDVTWVLPFMAHWRIAGFLRSCDATCFLERDFPITFHAPSIPREILACGSCLILSGEIHRKQPLRDRMIDGENFLLVEDPKNHDDLADALRHVLKDPSKARQIGLRGAELLRQQPSHATQVRGYVDIFEDVLARRDGHESRFTVVERGFGEGREGHLRALLRPLYRGLGAQAGEALVQQHLAAHPKTPSTPFEDAQRLLHGLNNGDPVRNDLMRYNFGVLWKAWFDDTHPDGPRFHELDRLPLAGSSPWNSEALLHLAPTRNGWVRLERFRHLPAAFGGGQGSEQIMIFHKLPSLTGHHFAVNRATAGLLEACDGRRTIPQIVASLADGEPPNEVQKFVDATLQRFYREGLIHFVEPRN